jgi:hypothetical protein
MLQRTIILQVDHTELRTLGSERASPALNLTKGKAPNSIRVVAAGNILPSEPSTTARNGLDDGCRILAQGLAVISEPLAISSGELFLRFLEEVWIR